MRLLEKKGQSGMIMMVLLELVMLLLLGTTLIGFISNVTKFEDFKLKSVARDVALIFSAMYSLNDDVAVTYITPYENKDYFIRGDSVSIQVYKKSNEDSKMIFPYVHNRSSSTSFEEQRLILLKFLKEDVDFYAVGDGDEEESSNK